MKSKESNGGVKSYVVDKSSGNNKEFSDDSNGNKKDGYCDNNWSTKEDLTKFIFTHTVVQVLTRTARRS